MTELIWDGKYDQDGLRVAPLRVSLPFQTVESVNESAQQRQHMLDLFSAGRDQEWRNRLIWGDKKYVLPSLLDEFAGKVNLIYIDPPFNIGSDFSFTATIPDHPDTEEDETTSFVKEPSAIEMKAYRDTWGHGLDSYLQWFYETIILLRDLLVQNGSIYVHLDWHMVHYAKALLDEVYGKENFRNDIVWYYRKYQMRGMRIFTQNSDRILWYVKNADSDYIFHPQTQPLDKPKYLKRKAWDKDRQIIVNVRDEKGNLIYDEYNDEKVDDVWDIPFIGATSGERTGYNTQKPEAVLERIINASSNENDLILDCFVGSGTTAAEAEKLNRCWIACDLSRFAIHTTRKRLLAIENVRPFVVQNLGKYERQAWQSTQFSSHGEDVIQSYRKFILNLYQAQPINGYTWLHGIKAGRMVHVGGVDAPVTVSDITGIVTEFKRAVGTGKDAPETNGVDVLGWDFAFELNEVAKQQAALANIRLRFLRVPRDVMDKRAVEQGDIHFFELAALSVDVKVNKLSLTLALTDFVIPPDDVPEDVQRAIKHWSQWIDYWAVDWDYKGDTFHNQWQTYRTRKSPDLQKSGAHTYDEPGEYTVVVKVIDILGNDTTKSLQVKVG
ncbi:MAG TPA: DNA methyltransferase [Anaerolineaceae bacterium]|nr:DNA methyltransferase [Anaerolineaceae bacterium]